MSFHRWLGVALCCLGACWGSARAADVDQDFEFARRLIDAGFPDYAERLVDEMVRIDPSLKDRTVIVRVNVLSARGKFEDAEKLLASIPGMQPKAQAARLVLAKRYYAARNVEKARDMFESFFKQIGEKVPEDSDLKAEYQDASYMYGQMMENFGDYASAAEANLRILKSKPDNDLARRVRSETANLFVRAARSADSPEKKENYRNRAYKLCEEIQWDEKGSADLWFVNSIATQAIIEYDRGKIRAAEKLIKQNLDLMSGVDDILKETDIPISMSPMAPARFILGEVRETEGNEALSKDKKKGIQLLASALQHYVNVYAKYGGSDWGPDAGVRAEKLYARLQSMKVNVPPIDFGKYAGEVIRQRRQQADSAFMRENFTEAARLYTSMLSSFSKDPGPFGNLTVCYARTDQQPFLDATVDQICERYAGQAPAGLGLLSAAKFYFDSGKSNACVTLYRRYVDAFPNTDKTASILFLTASMLKKEGRAQEGDEYLRRLIRDFKGDRNYLLALQQMGQVQYEAKDYDGAIVTMKQYIADSLPSPPRAAVQAMLADSYYKKNDFANTVREYRTLAQWLENMDQNPYAKTEDEVKRAAKYKETAMFFTGFAMTKISEPADMVPKFREKAAEDLSAFMKANPKSDWAAKALYVIGTVHLELGRTEDAAKAFDRLQAEYPSTEEGKNAGVSLVLAALDIKNFDLAKSTLAGMMKKDPPGEACKVFTAPQMASVGGKFFDAKMYDEAVQVLSKVMMTPGVERPALERSLYGLGMSYYEQKKYDEAIKPFESLLSKYPNSALFFQAKLTLGRAYRDSKKFTEAIAVLSDVFKFADDPSIRDEANLLLARVQRGIGREARNANKKDEADKAFRQAAASYMRVVELSNPDKPELRGRIEECAYEIIGIYEEMERWSDAVRSCETYLGLFPGSPRVADVQKKRNDLLLKTPAGSSPAPAAPVPLGAPAAPAAPVAA